MTNKMFIPPQPDLTHFKGFKQWHKNQGHSENTIKNYVRNLKIIPKDVEAYFANDDLPARNLRIAAYRSYLTYLVKLRLISREDKLDAFESLKAVRDESSGYNLKKTEFPIEEWGPLMQRAPHRVARFGMWLGFHFGLRAGAILHLRVEDIDFENKVLYVRRHKEDKRKNQEFWKPKTRFSVRTLPLGEEQEEALKWWINEVRPKDLDHHYLLWIPKGGYKGNSVAYSTLYYWCKNTLQCSRPCHSLRYSFAQHYYKKSNYNISLLSKLMGHADVAETSNYLGINQAEVINESRELFNA